MIERQRRAKQRSAEAGKWKGGRRPYGYQANGITVREDEAQAVADTTTAVLAGASIRGLIKAWNAAGRRTTSGNKWATNSFRTMVLRVRNAGLMEHRGEIIGKAEWPAIVPESRWRALVDLLNNPGRRTNGLNVARRWVGSGLYRCECGAKLICSTSNKGPAYRCRDGCGKLSRQQPDVDEFVSPGDRGTAAPARPRRPAPQGRRWRLGKARSRDGGAAVPPRFAGRAVRPGDHRHPPTGGPWPRYQGNASDQQSAPRLARRCGPWRACRPVRPARPRVDHG